MAICLFSRIIFQGKQLFLSLLLKIAFGNEEIIDTIDTLSGFSDDFEEKSDEKFTWDSNFQVEGPDGAGDVRDKGYLNPGYWCDQRDFYDTGDEFHLDTTEFRHRIELGRRWTPIDRPVGPFYQIVGGENVQQNGWRWIGNFYGCGSTLVASDWAVIAAHCCTIPSGQRLWFFRE